MMVSVDRLGVRRRALRCLTHAAGLRLRFYRSGWFTNRDYPRKSAAPVKSAIYREG